MNKKILKLIITAVICMIFSGAFYIGDVSAAPKVNIKISDKNITIDKGKAKKLKIAVTSGKNISKKVIWSSSNRKVAAVDSNGKVTAKRAGKAVIKVRSRADKKVSAQCIVKVVLNDTKKLKTNIVRDLYVYAYKDKMIRTYDEYKRFIETLRNKYDTDYRYNLFAESVDIEKYDEQYFADKVLLLGQYLSKSFLCGSDVNKIERVRNANGKYTMVIKVDEYYEGYDSPSVAYGNMIMVEMPKAYADTVDKVKFEVVRHLVQFVEPVNEEKENI